jgi:hypothetical protein
MLMLLALTISQAATNSLMLMAQAHPLPMQVAFHQWGK